MVISNKTCGHAVDFLPAGPPFILLHGFAQSAQTWRGLALELRTAGSAVMTPRFGAGAMEQYCTLVEAAVVKVTEDVGVAPILVGYSMGGRLALETLTRLGGKLPLSGLVVESSGLGPENQIERELLARRNQEWAQRVRDEGVEKFIDWWETLPLFESQQQLSSGTRNRVRQERLSNDVETLAAMLENAGQHNQALAVDTLQALKVASVRYPVHYIAGELDTKYKAVAQRIQQEAPLVYTHVISDAGHNVHLEQPADFAKILKAF